MLFPNTSIILIIILLFPPLRNPLIKSIDTLKVWLIMKIIDDIRNTLNKVPHDTMKSKIYKFIHGHIVHLYSNNDFVKNIINTIITATSHREPYSGRAKLVNQKYLHIEFEKSGMIFTTFLTFNKKNSLNIIRYQKKTGEIYNINGGILPNIQPHLLDENKIKVIIDDDEHHLDTFGEIINKL